MQLPHFSLCLAEEKCRGFYTLTPDSEKGKWLCLTVGEVKGGGTGELMETFCPVSAAMMWLYLSLELVYISLLLISCTLLSVQLCIRAWFPSTQRWGQLLNAFAAVFTVLGGAPRLFMPLFAVYWCSQSE